MSGLVEIRKVLEIIASYCPDDDGTCSKADRDLREMLDEIENMDEVDAVPVVHGHWIERTDYVGDTYYDCSACGESWTTIEGDPWDNGMDYCPKCGALMDEVTK